jgi:hypothetical protein
MSPWGIRSPTVAESSNRTQVEPRYTKEGHHMLAFTYHCELYLDFFAFACQATTA